MTQLYKQQFDWLFIVVYKFAESSKNGKFIKIANNLLANASEKTRGPPWKAGEFGEMANWSKLPTTLRPMQMRRPEGPLGKPANLANLAKMANSSKSPTTWWPMQMGGREGPLEKPANLG